MKRERSIWPVAHGTVLIKGTGTSARPVRPEFLDEPTDDERLGGRFLGVVDSLMNAVRDGRARAVQRP